MEEILHHPTWNPVNNEIFTISTGDRRISEPSTVLSDTVDGWNPAPPGMYKTL